MSMNAPNDVTPSETQRTAVLLMAYGTPRTPEEILPYYTDIRRGRPPTDEQLHDLINRYAAIGGISPLAQRTESQRDALQAALDQLAPGQYMVTLGLKHAAPMIETAVDELAASILDLLADDDKRFTFGLAAQSVAEERFRAAHVASRVRDVYRAALTGAEDRG